MGLYEVQVQDDYGRPDIHFSMSGGFYARKINDEWIGGTPPRMNACKPPGEWQAFDIKFRAPRFDGSGKKIENARFLEVRYNGHVVHENVEDGRPQQRPHAHPGGPQGSLDAPGRPWPGGLPQRAHPAPAVTFRPLAGSANNCPLPPPRRGGIRPSPGSGRSGRAGNGDTPRQNRLETEHGASLFPRFSRAAGNRPGRPAPDPGRLDAAPGSPRGSSGNRFPLPPLPGFKPTCFPSFGPTACAATTPKPGWPDWTSARKPPSSGEAPRAASWSPAGPGRVRSTGWSTRD